MRRARRHRRDFRGARELAAVLAGSRTKRVSAILRVRNEQEFIAAAVRSIAPFVDEVVILDNASTDATPEIMRALARELPHVRTLQYPFEVARVGGENIEAVRAGEGASRRRLSSYYNWALRQCRCPFVLKWDGDMLAGDEFGAAWEAWRSGRYLSMSFAGVNVHADRRHLLAARSRDPAVVGRGVAAADHLANTWVSKVATVGLTYTGRETRLFPRFLTRYDDGGWWCERLQSPFTSGPFALRHRFDNRGPLFLHLKYCKPHPHANHSPDFATFLQGNIALGPPLPVAWRQILHQHRLLGY